VFSYRCFETTYLYLFEGHPLILVLPGPSRWGPISVCRNVGTCQPMLLDTGPAHVVLQTFNPTILTIYAKSRNCGDSDLICLLHHSLPAISFVQISSAAHPSGTLSVYALCRHQGTGYKTHIKQVSYILLFIYWHRRRKDKKSEKICSKHSSK
jgi:hypothetical protein